MALTLVSAVAGFTLGQHFGYLRGEEDTNLVRSSIDAVRTLSLIYTLDGTNLAIDRAKQDLEMRIDEHILLLGSGWAKSKGDANARNALRSGSANLNSAISGNSGHNAGPRTVWQ